MSLIAIRFIYIYIRYLFKIFLTCISQESLELETLPDALRCVQGLWRVKSGLRVRIDGDQAVGVGKLEVNDGRLLVQLDKPFMASIQGTAEIAETLTWDDGDVWQRLGVRTLLISNLSL